MLFIIPNSLILSNMETYDTPIIPINTTSITIKNVIELNITIISCICFSMGYSSRNDLTSSSLYLLFSSDCRVGESVLMAIWVALPLSNNKNSSSFALSINIAELSSVILVVWMMARTLREMAFISFELSCSKGVR